MNVLGRDVEGRATSRKTQVQGVSLDDYFGSDRLDFVKIDVEGAEALVLQGMRKILRSQRPSLVIEFHTQTGWDGRHALLDSGYVIATIDGIEIEQSHSAKSMYHAIAVPSENKEILFQLREGSGSKNS